MKTVEELLSVHEEVDPKIKSNFDALLALNKTQGRIYAGTVDPVVKQDRRSKNKAARKSRRMNRGK